ncbi:hypothetical protein F4777DRAFT_205442 [Nemania sp. FL0916]|nr:hypothetical protein F4777DRAFT_205442 [Nemania sp. FL0916]
MAHTPRTTTLPHPSYNAREIYGGPRPGFNRNTDHISRPSSFTTSIRRQPLSPTPSPNIGFTSPVRMEGGHQYGKSSAGTTPPLGPLVTHGQLSYNDGSAQGSGAHVKIDVQGIIDKGFFLSDGEWTCYRRNYFSCICSFNLTPHYPNVSMQYLPTGSATPYQVFGFAMSISAIISDNSSQNIELVQHTPKRDKGPTAKPDKVKLWPKSSQHGSHALGLYPDHTMPGSSRAIYDGGYGQTGQGPFATEHTFERIQFKQATANNGKRRAAQQYYHLIVELYADVGSHSGDQYIKIAERKSEKMIVRGRSPGHYQNERRGSTSSGPGGSSGMGSYSSSQVIGGDYGTGSSSILPNAYSGGYESRGHYSANRHHNIGMDPLIPADDAKAIDTTKDYQYYPSTIYENVEPRHEGIEMFSHRDGLNTMLTATTSIVDSAMSKVKHEFDQTPSIYQPGAAYFPRNCGRFEGRPTSAGYYPTALSQSG